MAEVIEAVELWIAAGQMCGGAECKDFKTLMKFLMGLAKVADIAVDWVLVAKLYSGDYCLKEVCGNAMPGLANATHMLVENVTMVNTTHTHDILVEEVGHGHEAITHTHEVAVTSTTVTSTNRLEGLGAIIVLACLAAVLGTIIELVAVLVAMRHSSEVVPISVPPEGFFAKQADKNAYNAALRRHKLLAAGRLLCDDVPTAAISIYLLAKAEFEVTDLVMLCLSGGYALLTLLYYCTRQLSRATAHDQYPGLTRNN